MIGRGRTVFKRIDHVEITTPDIEKSIAFYTNIMGFKLKERRKIEAGPLQEIAFYTLADTMIELMYPKNPAPASTQAWQVGYHGMAIQVEDMDKALAYLKDKGVEIVSGPAGTGTSKRAVIKDPTGVPIELRTW
jgi:glyoxylase I family protein